VRFGAVRRARPASPASANRTMRSAIQAASKFFVDALHHDDPDIMSIVVL
jgi:hypothetical protein